MRGCCPPHNLAQQEELPYSHAADILYGKQKFALSFKTANRAQILDSRNHSADFGKPATSLKNARFFIPVNRYTFRIASTKKDLKT